MRRAYSILIGILLGALAAAIGIGIFLHKANTDRKALAERMAETTRAANAAREQGAQAILNANQRVDAANEEVKKAQVVIRSLQEERLLMQKATILTPPSSWTIRGWKTITDIEHGIAFTIPVNQDASSTLWFTTTNYDAATEQSELATLTATSSVIYLTNGRLLTGWQGQNAQGVSTLLLQIRDVGTIRYLLRMQDPNNLKTPKTLLTVLATMTFK